MKIERPEGYRAPTDVEMDCLPEGAIWLHGSEGWRASLFVGQQSQDISERYAVPITPKSKPTSAPTPPHEDCGCVLCIDAHIKKGLSNKPADLDPKGEIGKTKCPLHLIPPQAMEETAHVHALGAHKYGPFNWRTNKVCATTYISAMMRHLNAWRGGEDNDPESGRSHLAHIAANCFILMDAMLFGKLVDDRAK